MVKRQPKIIGNSPALQVVLASADRAAPTTMPVLILGESGTGKELIARRIHEKSERGGAFVALNCAALPKDLLESELFGHEKGAFTGAVQAKAGAFERAHGGTLFLDEIGDMAPESQVKILRAIQEGEVQRIGGAEPRSVDVRIVAATHRDLQARIAAETFREDLYYRLAVRVLELPPLRDRRDDIAAIATAFLEREAPGKSFSQGAQTLLVKHRWPGNVRELENVVRVTANESDEPSISAAVLRKNLRGFAAKVQPTSCDPQAGLRQLLERCGRVTPADLRAAVGVSRATASRMLTELVTRKVILREGTGRGCTYSAVGKEVEQVSTRSQVALGLAKAHGRLSRRDYEKAAAVTARTAKRDLAELVERQILVMVGAGRGACYQLAAGRGPNQSQSPCPSELNH